MGWIFALGIIGIFVFILIKYPKFRKVVLAGIALIVVGIFLYIGNGKLQENRSRNLIPFDQVQIDNFRLKRDDSSSKLSGEITNKSAYDLTDVFIKVTAYDCPGDKITKDCRVIGEDDDVDLSVSVPSGQVRALSEYGNYVYLGNMPPIKGNFYWTYDITGTKGMTSKNPSPITQQPSTIDDQNDSPDISSQSDTNNANSYLIILGSFKDKDSARQYAVKVHGRVFDSSEFNKITPGIFAVVNSTTYGSNEEAKQALAILKSNAQFNDAYVKDGGMFYADPQSIEVRHFYLSLETGDGAAAVQSLIPEKRETGHYTTVGLTTFWSNQDKPLLLIDVAPTSDSNTFEAMYTYKPAGKDVCTDTAAVTLQRSGQAGWLISKIVPTKGC